MNKSGKVDNDKVQKEFDKIQKSLKSHGYQAKSVNDIYHDERSSYYFAVVDGLFLLVNTILTYDSDTINYIIVTKIT